MQMYLQDLNKQKELMYTMELVRKANEFTNHLFNVVHDMSPNQPNARFRALQ